MTAYAEIAFSRSDHQRFRRPRMQIVAAQTVERTATYGIRDFIAHRVRNGVLMLVAAGAQFQNRLLEIASTLVAMWFMARAASVLRVRILADGFHAARRIVTLCTKLLLRAAKQLLLIRRMRVMALFAGALRSRTMRHIPGELVHDITVAICADLLHGAFQRIAAVRLLSRMAGRAILLFKRRVFVAHDQTRRIACVRIVTCRTARADRIKAHMPFPQLLLIAVT